ncbi:LOW QUALITY PROTEIN: hypothetical protein PanWU01x14_369280 [Parasponia andersonii]|uniref:Uncharacterized protein n=1 Tax=Parasponia andersonii TaxID=3476 RepID=A0A2P5A4P8_PARAD|nr:LOW QUALITY PROTEIN: hypothetical protein PanWU01x14_369280 [Parasponia andersonii]
MGLDKLLIVGLNTTAVADLTKSTGQTSPFSWRYQMEQKGLVQLSFNTVAWMGIATRPSANFDLFLLC